MSDIGGGTVAIVIVVRYWGRDCRYSYSCQIFGAGQHRVDIVVESSLREIVGSKNFALINLSLNFCETTIYDNKVFLENLVAGH